MDKALKIILIILALPMVLISIPIILPMIGLAILGRELIERYDYNYTLSLIVVLAIMTIYLTYVFGGLYLLEWWIV